MTVRTKIFLNIIKFLQKLKLSEDTKNDYLHKK